MGMFEYRKEDEKIIVRKIINDLKNSVEMSMMKGMKE
jgi:hypothetical protein